VGAIPAVAPAAGVPGPPGFPSYGDPVLDARRRAIAAVTDAATAAATKDAAAGSANLGMLAQLAGMGRVQTQGTTLPPAVAALPGILSQDAQQGLLTRNALAVDSANRIAPYMRAQGLSTLAQFDAGIRDAKLKARADELDFLGRIYQQAILSGNAQLADATKRAIADKQAQTALDVAGTRAEATKTAAQIAADARVKTAGGGGGAGGKTPAQKAAYVVLKNQWVKAAKYDAATGSFGPRDGGTDPTTGAKIRIPGEKPRQFVNRMIKAGVTPVDAIGIADAAGVTMNYKMIYVWLIPHVGKKRARLLTMRLAGGSDPTAREG